jgi:pyruvate/2-oxoglutarate dehydrogenase complex dihydrolipoamide acyltransferase (E2) component
MSKVEFTYSKGGKRVSMAMRYAETLRKMGHGTYETRMLTAAPPKAPDEQDGPLVSKEIAAFAAENNVDLAKVAGTGKDGRIKKSDVEAFIAVQV